MVGPRLVMMMDEISTGLDSSTTFQMVQSIRHLAHLQRATICVALLQPAPEVFDLFDDIMVLAEGKMVHLDDVSLIFSGQFLRPWLYNCNKHSAWLQAMAEGKNAKALIAKISICIPSL